MTEPSEQRIAIRFGSASTSRTSTRPAALGKRQRPKFHEVDDDDSDAEDHEHEDAQHVSITHFGANGAEYVDDEPRERQTTKDRAKTHRRSASPAHEHHQKSNNKGSNVADSEDEEPLKYGLTVAKRTTEEPSKAQQTEEEDAPRKPKTADEEAMDALLGKDTTRQRIIRRTEDDAYRDAASIAPEPDDVATYDDIPVEGFGAFLLKGQGWDGKMRGPKTKEVVRRPNGMGLGAKKLGAEEELGGWDQKGKRKSDKRPRLDDYHREKDKERSRREERYRDSYKNERDRERDRRYDSGRDRDRERDRDRDRNRDSHRQRDRDHRR